MSSVKHFICQGEYLLSLFLNIYTSILLSIVFILYVLFLKCLRGRFVRETPNPPLVAFSVLRLVIEKIADDMSLKLSVELESCQQAQ